MKRRSWLKLGLASAAVLAVAGGGLALMSPGLLPDGRLSDAGRKVMHAVSRAILEGTVPSQDAALDALLTRIGDLTAALPPHAQAELSQLLALLASSAGRLGLAGLSTDWDTASNTDIQTALQGMRTSSLMLKRQAYGALHDIPAAAWFADSSTWGSMAYPGPMKI
jgi:hypothetical protein